MQFIDAVYLYLLRIISQEKFSGGSTLFLQILHSAKLTLSDIHEIEALTLAL